MERDRGSGLQKYVFCDKYSCKTVIFTVLFLERLSSGIIL